MTGTKIAEGPLARLHEQMAARVASGEIPGLITVIARGDDVRLDVLGHLAEGGAGGPLRRDSIFRISSMSKPVVAVAAMLCVEDGTLRLDEPVDRLLPELANRRVLRRPDAELDDTVPAERPILVRDLLTFTCGFGLVLAPPGTTPYQRAVESLELGFGPPAPEHIAAPDLFMARLGSLPLLYQPGDRWMYNAPADVLSVLVARAAGQPLERFLEERIFAPLGMKDTGFFVPAGKRDRFATSYGGEAKGGGLEVYDRPDGQWSHPPAFPSGAGGLVSTADDYLAFARMLLGGGALGATRVLRAATVAEMTRDQLTPAQKARTEWFGYFENHGWGYGMSVVTGEDDAGSIGTFGWDGGMGTSFRADPVTGGVTLLFTQRAWPSPQPPAVYHELWSASGAALGRDGGRA